MVLFLKSKSCSKIINVHVPNYVCFAILSVCVVVRSRDTAQEAARQLAGRLHLGETTYQIHAPLRTRSAHD